MGSPHPKVTIWRSPSVGRNEYASIFHRAQSLTGGQFIISISYVEAFKTISFLGERGGRGEKKKGEKEELKKKEEGRKERREKGGREKENRKEKTRKENKKKLSFTGADLSH
jgi:hypothetical protein